MLLQNLPSRLIVLSVLSLIFTGTNSVGISIFANAETAPTVSPMPSPKISSSPSQSSISIKPTISSPKSDPQTVSKITITVKGVDPIGTDDVKVFEEETVKYIQYFFGQRDDMCDTCVQGLIYGLEVDIDFLGQDPPLAGDNSNRLRRLGRNVDMDMDMNMNMNIDLDIHHTNNNMHNRQRQRQLQDNKLTITYSQTVSYRRVATSTSANEPPLDINTIISEPFNNLIKRKNYVSWLKLNAPPSSAFENIKSVTQPSIPEESTFFGIYFIIGISVGGVACIIAFVLLCCWCKRRNNKSVDNGHGHGHGGMEHAGHDMNGNNPPSQVKYNLPTMKDEVSTLVDPSPQYGIFSDNTITKAYNNAPSVATGDDPDYMGLYSGRPGGDASVISSVGGTLGSATQKSKMSVMDDSLLNRYQGFNGGQSVLDASVDEESFQAHLQNQLNKVTTRENVFEIYAPAGKLGVVIDTPDSGAPVVHNIKETCPISDQLQVGDKLIAVDDEDVRTMTAIAVSKLISQKSGNPTRKFTVSRILPSNNLSNASQ